MNNPTENGGKIKKWFIRVTQEKTYTALGSCGFLALGALQYENGNFRFFLWIVIILSFINFINNILSE